MVTSFQFSVGLFFSFLHVVNSTCVAGKYQSVPPNGFIFHSAAKSWADSETACVALGKTCHLASIHSSAENTIVKNKISTTSWIGLNDIAKEGTFVNNDGTSSDYTNWLSGEPNQQGDEDCTTMSTSGTWNDASCTGLKASVCKCITAETCTTCPPGCVWQNFDGGNLLFKPGETATTACSDGSTNGWTCLCVEPCPSGQYQNQSSMETCKSCLPGSYNDETGQTSCKSCPEGYFPLSDKNACYNEVESQAVSYTTGVPAMIGAMLIIQKVIVERQI